MATWSCLILLLSIHLAMNHAAVRAVSMHTLNRQRANIVLSHLLDYDTVLNPEAVSAKELIFERDGVLRWNSGPVMAYAKIGTRLQTLANVMGRRNSTTSSTKTGAVGLEDLTDTFRQEYHILWYSPQQVRQSINIQREWGEQQRLMFCMQRLVVIVLKEGVSAASQLKAWAHALLLVRTWNYSTEAKSIQMHDAGHAVLEMAAATLGCLNESWASHLAALRAEGWDVDTANLETVSGTRICPE